ncbi:MAG: restriction endonuclease subunit S [Anaerolineales bacterium]|nr:restriction endonuclease subunit S [Anaerolineales bacterium]
MKKYPIVPLGEVCDFVYGDSLKETDRKGGDIPVYGSNGIVGWHDEAITKGETIIVGRKGSIGEIHLSKIPCWAIDTTYYIDKTKVPCDFTWLYYTLKALDLTRLNKSAAVPGLNRDDAYEQKISLPPLTEQKRIASLLARADRLRSLRRTARELGESLLQSVFLEMFGDPKINSKKWDIEAIGELVKPTKQINPKSLGLSEFWYVDITSIDRQNKTIVEPKLLDIEDAPSRARKQISANDILVSTVRPNLNAVAKVPQHLDNQIASTGFCVLRPDIEYLSSEYLFAIVQSKYFVDYLVKNETGANYPAVSDGIILDTPIPVPPLALQEEFAAIASGRSGAPPVSNVEGLRGRMSEAERQAQGLFESLLAESFA